MEPYGGATYCFLITTWPNPLGLEDKLDEMRVIMFDIGIFFNGVDLIIFHHSRLQRTEYEEFS